MHTTFATCCAAGLLQGCSLNVYLTSHIEIVSCSFDIAHLLPFDIAHCAFDTTHYVVHCCCFAVEPR